MNKLAAMGTGAFGPPPFVSTYGGWGRAAVIMDGPRLGTLPAGAYVPPTKKTPMPRSRPNSTTANSDRRGLLIPSPPRRTWQPTTGLSST